jgi:hypothetical protein
VWEFRFVDSSYISYRAFKYPWDRCNLIADTTMIADSITAIAADLHWNNNPKFSAFILQYKECSSSTWLDVPLDTNFFHLDGLLMNTCYDWRVESICAMYGDSFYTPIHQFTTLNPLDASGNETSIHQLALYPNPALNETAISFYCDRSCVATIAVYDVTGRSVLTSSQKCTGNLAHRIAIIEISTFIFRGSPAAATVSRAGKSPVK